jgi:heterodisulfide reductase subunit D
MTRRHYRFSDLLSMEACTGCRLCADICPAVSASGTGRLSAVTRLDHLKKINRKRFGIFQTLRKKDPMLSPENLKKFGETVFGCTLCGRCEETCPVKIPLRHIWISLREDMTDSGSSPAKTGMILENLKESHNVFNENNEERAEWVEDLDDPPDHGYLKKTADVVYFTGCVSSYFPLAQKIPIGIVKIFEALDVDFTLLGEDEWCCGFPLLGAGMGHEAESIISHNMDAVRKRNARTVVFACPSCYQMWREHYPKEFELLHVTEYLDRLFKEKKPDLNTTKLKVTYHDPCDLGRGGGVYDAPRELIKALPGVEFVELPNNRENCVCCGGGGNLEMIDPDLSAKISGSKLDEVLATGADAVVTACQQCVRTMTGHVRRNKLKVRVLDVTELIAEALEDE